MTLTQTNNPHIEMVPTVSLKPNPRNARKHSAKQISQIAASINKFGFVVPLVVDESDLIAAGNGRWEAATLLKLPDVPVIRTRFLTDADRRAFALTENRLAELGGWDESILADELNALFGEGYNLDITGFSIADIDLSIGAVEKANKPERVELPGPSAIAVSRPGDLWLIGPHRLYCGDACASTSYEALLASELATMIFSDPPYGVRIDGFATGKGKVRHREFASMSGEQTPPELIAFLRSMMRLCARFSIGGSIHFHCMDRRHIREILDGVYAELKQMIVWDKGSGALGSFYRNQYELIFVFKAGKGRHINNFGLGETGRYRTNIWKMPGANAFRKGRAEDLADHPTVKPTALAADAMLDCSNRGDLILDPFCGSGTSLLAAHKTGRRGAAIEIDPLYVDTALRRLKAASGLEPKLADGRTFEEVKRDRASEKEAANG